MLQKLILLGFAFAGISAEPPVRAPYAPAGWRPRVPFSLPGNLETSVEISRQRVEHAGTLHAAQLASNYLPPNMPGQQPVSKQVEDETTPSPQYGTPADGTFRIDYPEEEVPAPSSDLQRSKIKEGRYYIVADDNKLQRVLYRTVQTAGDDLTAQLRYSAVGKLQDPVYKYNSQGQLERVLK
ncbi:uncharacterized protein LOC111597128 [Drosophila hydei]|uniref:Uncharacterized protein LOC111597128 n=1 Tax=Drosophila hydei TaxID=7224 RepID=A0A6J1LNC6_DROHY|nr:uncharacterized protein LOC111597128 [Drosophila hydei]